MVNRGTRRERLRYNPVSATEAENTQEGEDVHHLPDGDSPDTANNHNERRNNSRRPRSPQYSRLSSDASPEGEEEDVVVEEDNLVRSNSHVSSTTTTTTSTAMEEISLDDDDSDRINVTVLDFAQSRFQVPAVASWTVAQFKQAGTKIHKVTPARQRLIFRGKMLDDPQKTLAEYGITQDDLIVHLFPKPRVVISDTTTTERTTVSDNNSPDSTVPEEDDGARIPTIVMDSAEAERRSQILVLGSADFIEAQNNVKLFSFMLLIISSIELLNLFAIAMGVPQQQNGNETAPGIPIQEDDYNVMATTDDFVFGGGGSSNNHTLHLFSPCENFISRRQR